MGSGEKLMMKLEKEQEVLMNIADMAIENFVAESLLLRVMKMSPQNEEPLYIQDMLGCYMYDAADRILKSGKGCQCICRGR